MLMGALGPIRRPVAEFQRLLTLAFCSTSRSGFNVKAARERGRTSRHQHGRMSGPELP